MTHTRTAHIGPHRRQRAARNSRRGNEENDENRYNGEEHKNATMPNTNTTQKGPPANDVGTIERIGNRTKEDDMCTESGRQAEYQESNE